MSSPMRALLASTLLTMAQAQGVIIRAQGPAGPASPGLLVDPYSTDANIINKQEIIANVVNECGRTILQGNIDIGEETENNIGNKTVTQVTAGANVDVFIAQISADGAGPYSCDLDLTSNSNGASGQTKLEVQESQPQNGQIQLSVKMPDNMACVGASTGDICTVRCFNNNAKGPFGGCFAVQQTDITPKQNTPGNIPTAATLEGVNSQVKQDINDFAAAVKSNQEAATQADQGLTAVKELLANSTQVAAGPAAGNANTPNANTGDANTPNANTGDANTGDANTGNANTGNANTGNANTGNANTPNAKAGNAKAGNANTPNANADNTGAGNAKGKGRRGKGKGLAGLAALLGGGGGGGAGGRGQRQQQANNKRGPEDLLSSRFARRTLFGRND